MTVRAHYDGKNFVPEEPVSLPDGTVVTLTVVPTTGASPLRALSELARQNPITDSPRDWSEQHDHYIRGTPKR